MVRRAAIGPVAQRRGRRHADREIAPVRAVEIRRRGKMRVAMEDQLGAAPCEHVPQRLAVAQRFAPAHRVASRRMVQEHDAEASGNPRALQHPIEPFELAQAEPAGGEEGRRRSRRRQADQRHSIADAKRRKRGVALGLARVVTAHVGRPLGERVAPRLPDVRIVIAGNDGDALRRAEPSEPRRGLPELVRQSDVREITGDGDMVGPAAREIDAERIEHLGAMLVAAPVAPRKIAEDPLVEERADTDAVERGQMQIGQVRQHEVAVRRGVGARVLALVRVDRELYGRHAVSI